MQCNAMNPKVERLFANAKLDPSSTKYDQFNLSKICGTAEIIGKFLF